jgi:cytochrome c-type biogenesis protein CcmH/NrfF
LLLLLALLCLSPALTAQPAHAEQASASSATAAEVPADDGSLTPAQERRASAIARQTMSPFCPGRTLADCPSGYAAEWRADIRDMVAKGMSASEIQQELESRAGSNLSGSPNRNASYGLSIFFALLAVGVLVAVFFRLRASGDEGSAPGVSGKSPGEGNAPRGKKAGSKKAAVKKQAAQEGSKEESTSPMVDEARLDAELAAEDEGPID